MLLRFFNFFEGNSIRNCNYIYPIFFVEIGKSIEMFRDDLGAYLGGRNERRKVLREIVQMEEQELYGGGGGSSPGTSSGNVRPAGSASLKGLTAAHHNNSLSAIRSRSPEQLRAVSAAQQHYMERLARPVSPPQKVFTDFIRAPRSIQGAGLARSQDVLFEPDDDGSFWLYGAQKVTQSTIGTIGPNPPTDDEIRKLPVCAAVRKRIDNLISVAATKNRCGIIFDIISTSRVIAGGIPHKVGAYIYEYIDQAHYDVVGLKFVFVGITDNVNCCSARDVFCRDDRLNGKYIGDTKRPFDALDNVHMFTVFPGHRLHPFSGTTSTGNETTGQVSNVENASFTMLSGGTPEKHRPVSSDSRLGGSTFVTQSTPQ